MKDETLFYCYQCPSSGYYKINGYKYFCGEDFRTEKRYREYLDCGFNMVQARGENSYKGEGWEGSNCQRVFIEALKAGCDKILVTDGRFDHWIRDERDLVGEGKLFVNETELDKAVAECIAPYCNQKGFYGIQLFDEPIYDQFPAYGQIMRSIKRLLPNVYVQANLLPMTARESLLQPQKTCAQDVAADKMATETISRTEIYKKYVEDFQTITGADNIHFDEYPFRREYIISGNTLPNYQLVARICQEKGLEFRAVLQSFANIWNGTEHNRRMTESDMYWQTNFAMGFGVRDYSFYTYMAKPDFDNKNGAMVELDGAAFINLDGSQTALYGYTKRIIAEMKQFLPIMQQYAYCSSHIVTETGKTHEDYDWTKFAYENEPCSFAVSVDKGVALVTKQTNAFGALYMFENIGNVRDELFDGIPPMKLRAELPSGEKTFYFRGETVEVSADENGVYSFDLTVGDAIFVVIKSAK